MDGIRDNIGRFRDNVQFFIITIAAHVCVSWYEVFEALQLGFSLSYWLSDGTLHWLKM